jgi:hypothetical protein
MDGGPRSHSARRRHARAVGPEGVGILLAMTIPLRTRVYVMTIMVLA